MDKRYCPLNIIDNKEKNNVLFVYCQEEKCMWWCPDIKECITKGIYMELMVLNERRV